MATPGRDEGLDKLEAFIALLDAARDRIEEGGERLDTAAGDLRENAEELAEEAHRLEQMVAEHLRETGVDELVELAAAAASNAEATREANQLLADTVEALMTLGEASLEFLLSQAAEMLADDERKHVELLREMLVKLRESKVALTRELLEKTNRVLQLELEEAEKLKEASVALSVAMIAVSVVLVVIAIVVAVFTFGAGSGLWTVCLIAAVAAIVSLCVTIVQSVPLLLDGIATLMRLCGFSEAGEAIDGAAVALQELLGQDWFKWTLFAVTIVAVFVSLLAAMGAATAVATVVTAMAAVMMVAVTVVENVARLLSALNPFD